MLSKPDMKTNSNADIDKIGNAIVFFAERISDLSKTKLLKLLYLSQEMFVRKYNVPMLRLEFDVWQAGPVSRDIYIDLSDEPILLDEFVSTVRDENATYIETKVEFSDDEFSDDELVVLEVVNEKFGGMTATKLVDYTHRRTSLWYRIAQEKGLLEDFNAGYTNSSDEKIDFTRLLDDPGKEAYLEQIHFNELISAINL